jgi:hypothetical protein
MLPSDDFRSVNHPGPPAIPSDGSDSSEGTFRRVFAPAAEPPDALINEILRLLIEPPGAGSPVDLHSARGGVTDGVGTQRDRQHG